MGNSNSAGEMPRPRMERLEMRHNLLCELERCKDSLQSLSNRRSELRAEREGLSADGNGQKEADRQRRLIAVGTELLFTDGRIAREEKQLGVLNARLGALRAMAIGS